MAAFSAGLPIDCESVDLSQDRTSGGVNYSQINPRSMLPCLKLKDGTILSEEPIILEYIADKAVGKVAPVAGTTERYLVDQMLNYISTSFLPPITAIAKAGMTEVLTTYHRDQAQKVLSYLDNDILVRKQFAVGAHFTIADCYLFAVLTTAASVGFDFDNYSFVKEYYTKLDTMERIKGARHRIQTIPDSVVDKPVGCNC